MYIFAYVVAMAYMLLLFALFGNRRRGIVPFLAALGFGVVGFTMTPNPDLFVDTVRFFETLDATRTYLAWSPVEAWQYLMGTSGYNSTPIMGLIMYVLAFLPSNGWLTFLASFLDVGAALFIIHEHTRSKDNIGTMMLSSLVFVCLFNFNAAVTGVRNAMAVFLSVAIVYWFSTKGKKILPPLILCIPLALIHPFALIVPIFYILGFSYKRHKIIFVLFCIGALFQRSFQATVFNLLALFPNIPFFSNLSFKSTQYFGEGAYIGASSSFATTRNLLLLILYIAVLCAAFLVKNNLSSQYLGFSLLMTCFTVGAFGDAILFSRSVASMLVVILPALCDIISSLIDLGQRCRWSYVVLAMMGIVSVVILADNLRAGCRFEIMKLSYTSLLLMSLIFISTMIFYLLPAKYKQIQSL